VSGPRGRSMAVAKREPRPRALGGVSGTLMYGLSQMPISSQLVQCLRSGLASQQRISDLFPPKITEIGAAANDAALSPKGSARRKTCGGTVRRLAVERPQPDSALLPLSRHRPIRDFAVQRSPTIGCLSKIQNNSGLSQGLCGRTARLSCYGLNSQNRSSRWEREHGSSPGLFESKERRALILLRRGTAHGRLRARRR
jgi:hypothetical protein